MKARLIRFDFWQLVGAVSVRTKILGIVAITILMLGLAMAWYAFRDVSVVLKSELEQRAIAIGNSLALQSRDFVLTDNQFALYNVIKSTIAVSEDIVYAFVLDHNGNVLVHSFDTGFPSDLMKINQVQPGIDYHVQKLQAENEIIMDVAVPILDGQAGVVHLGVSERSAGNAIGAYIRKVIIWVLFALVIGLSFAYVFATLLTNPITSLAKEARIVGSDDFKWQAPPWVKDELGDIGNVINKMDTELKRREAMRVLLLAKVIHAQEEERKRVARELHDESGQNLTSLMVSLKATEEVTDSKHLKEKLAGLRFQVGITLDRLRHLSMELRPSLLDNIGLGGALQKYVQEYSSKNGIHVDCRLGDIGKIPLLPEEETTIYRIVQEALTNIAKHANARNVSVVAGLRDSDLALIIEDDGKGFDLEKTMGGGDGKRLGIFGMEERAALVGGKVTIESVPGEGTIIIFDLPAKTKRGLL